MSHLLARLGVGFRLRPEPARHSPHPGSARTAARTAVAFGAATFALATAVLAVSLETARPEWRDPEFGRRLRQIEKWKADAPDRPLVLVLGSSRVQMGVSPAAMELPDGPGDPLVYNLGMVGALSREVLLNLIRTREAGIRPRAALIELAPMFLTSRWPAERHLLDWSDRMTHADLRRIAPYAGDLSGVRRRWAVSRLNPWPSFGLRLLSAWAPAWVPADVREDAGGDRMDAYGFLPHRYETHFPPALARARVDYFGSRSKPVGVSDEADRSVRDLIALCRAEGVAVAFFWTPESATFRGYYPPGERKMAEEFGRKLSREEDVSVFPEPEHFTELDFFDGHHLMKMGAARYSRWLAATHLKPWLARQR